METDSNTTTPHGESWMGYSQIIKCRCGCPLHVTSATGFCSETCEREAAEEASHLAQARYLGADAAMAAASWLTMDEADARSILTDVDPEVMDRYAEPDLRAWEEACDEKLGDQVTGHGGWIYDTYVGDDLAVAWEEGRDEVWSDALQAHAIRVLGDTAGALELERDLENRVDALRIKAAHA